MTIALACLGALVLAVLLARHVRVKVKVSGGASFRDLREFSSALNQVTHDYFTANYGGDPSELEDTLRGLLSVARGMAAHQPRPIDDEMVCTLVVSAVAAHQFAPRHQVEVRPGRHLAWRGQGGLNEEGRFVVIE